MSGSNFTDGVENTPSPSAAPGKKAQPNAFKFKGLNLSQDPAVLLVNSKKERCYFIKQPD